MKEYYECHITYINDKPWMRNTMKMCGWKFSQIDGDPDLGDGIKCYATKQYNTKFSRDEIIDKMTSLSDTLELSGAKILRNKIELVIYDKRMK